jgi:hypothetical protein
MAVEIVDTGASLKITTDGVIRYVVKNQIREISIVRDTIIKLDLGKGSLYDDYIDQSSVDVPQSKSVQDLSDQLNAMLQTDLAGFATAKKQDDQMTQVAALQAVIADLQTKMGSMNDKLFYEPLILDEQNPNSQYKGYALPGSKTSDAVWAVLKVTNKQGSLTYQWAGGTRAFASIWDNRSKLIYS